MDWDEKRIVRDELVERFVREIGASELPYAYVEQIPGLMHELIERAFERQTHDLEFKVDQGVF